MRYGFLMRKSWFALATVAASSLTAGCLPPHSVSLVPAGPISGALPRSIDHYIANADQFRAFVDGLYFGAGTTASRPACTSFPCSPANATTTTLTIEGIPELRRFAAANAGPNGTIVARITNGGMHADSTFRTAIAGPDIVRHFIVVRRTVPGPGSTWELIRYNPVTPSVMRTGAIGTFLPCLPVHTPDPNKIPVARFGGCRHEGEYGSVTSVPRAGPAPLGLGAALLEHGGDSWIHCDHGCCETTVTSW